MSGNGEPNPPTVQGGIQANVRANAQNLVSQLMGLNQDPAQSTYAGTPFPNVPAKKSNFASIARRVKLSDAFQGINVTPNFLFLLLFVGFTAWLWVVYFVRHHEPLANDVLGVGAAHSATAEADRRLVAGIKKTLPIRTSHTSGDFYVPIPQGEGRFAASGDFGYPRSYEHPVGSAGMSMPLPPSPVPAPSPIPPEPTPLSATYSPYAAAPAQAIAPTQHHAYLVPVQATAGTRVKMIVNR